MTPRRRGRHPIPLAGQHVAVMGLGSHGGGIGVTKFLLEQGASVVVSELQPRDAFDAEKVAEVEEAGAILHFGGHENWHFDGADIVVRNPAVPSTSEHLQYAADNRSVIHMEMSLFMDRWEGPVVGVTGTKGKTTAAHCCYEVLREDRPTVQAGNMTISAVGFLGEYEETSAVTAVLELSSFQLEGFADYRLSPEVAIITNLGEDHLDRYDHSMQRYWDAKANIFRFQRAEDLLVLPAHDSVTLRAVEHRTSVAGDGYSRLGNPRHAYFSDARLPHGLDGAWLARSHLWARVAGEDVEIAALSELSLSSLEAQLDLAAAVAAAIDMGVSVDHLRRVVPGIRPVRHRREHVATVGNLRFINDTTATCPTAAIPAINSCADDPLAVIVGGRAKGMNFEKMAATLYAHADFILLLDHPAYDGTELIRRALPDDALPRVVGGLRSMEDAVQQALFRLGSAGGVVLLSPGTASQGMFRDEFQRGDQFRDLVLGLPGAVAAG